MPAARRSTPPDLKPGLPGPRPLRAPRGIAHRGGPALPANAGVENTLAAFARAAALGLDLETDVHASADGVAVLSHDPDLLRVTGSPGNVAEMPWRELRRRLVGGREPLARLDDLLDALPEVQVNVDVKDRGGVAATVAAIRRTHVTHRPSADRHRARDVPGAGSRDAGRVTVASFSPVRAAGVRRALGHGVGWSATPPEIAALIAAARLTATGPLGAPARALRAAATRVCRGVDCIQVPTHLLAGRGGAALVGTAHALGIEVHVWTVDDPQEMTRLFAAGVDAVISDAPDVLADVLAGDLTDGSGHGAAGAPAGTRAAPAHRATTDGGRP